MKPLLLAFLFINLSLQSYGQYPVLSKSNPDDLHKQYFSSNLDKKAYLDSTTSLLYRFYLDGEYFDGSVLLRYLQLYKQIAWGDKSYVSFRSTYYKLLANNARMQNRGGEAIYYYEKLDREQELIGSGESLNTLMQVCYVHTRNKNFKRAILSYEKRLPYFNKIPDLLRTNKLTSEQAVTAIYVLSPVASSYAFTKDSVKVQRTIALAKSIKMQLFKKISAKSEDGIVVCFLIAGMEYYQQFALTRDLSRIRVILREVEQILYGNSELTANWRDMLATNYNEWLADYYLQTLDNDSAAVYIHKMAADPTVSHERQLRLSEFKAWLSANKSGYTHVYLEMKKILTVKDSLSATVMDQMDNLFYVHTQAENDRNDLILANKEKRDKNNIIAGISAFFFIVLGLVFLRGQQKDRVVKQRVEQLKTMADIQISELEEIKHVERVREQQRLGRELHDQLSSHVAAVKYRLERLANVPDDISKYDITDIRNQIDDIYSAVRDKSHQWAWQQALTAEKSFQDRIRYLISLTLPENVYQTTVELDDDILNGLVVEDKIQILHVIQEAVTNVLKHANASIVFILLYEDGDDKVLLIEDNGKGFKPHRPIIGFETLGLQSIQIRAENLNGVLSIESGINLGTKIRIVIPSA